MTQARKKQIIDLLWKGAERMKRFICGILCLCLLWTGVCFTAAAEDVEAELTEEELEEIRKLDEEDIEERVTGKVYQEKTAILQKLQLVLMVTGMLTELLHLQREKPEDAPEYGAHEA